MDEAPFSLKAFKNYIEKWTDLELEYMREMENESSLVENIRKFSPIFDYIQISLKQHITHILHTISALKY